MAPFRLAILECDTPAPGIIDPHPHLTSAFASLFDAARLLFPASHPLSPSHDDPQTRTDLQITRHHVVHPPEPGSNLPPTPCAESTYPDLAAVDALLISGAKHDAWCDKEWVLTLVEFTKKVLEDGRIPVVGVCFGHQIVARALGSEVRIGPLGREVAVMDVELTEEGKAVFGLDKMRIQQMRRDEVANLPEGATLLGSTTKCPIQAFYKPGKYICVQGHPEITEKIMRGFLTVRHDAGVFTDELFEDGMQRAGLEHDGVKIAKVFLEFITQ